jgi:hypothetical protein
VEAESSENESDESLAADEPVSDVSGKRAADEPEKKKKKNKRPGKFDDDKLALLGTVNENLHTLAKTGPENGAPDPSDREACELMDDPKTRNCSAVVNIGGTRYVAFNTNAPGKADTYYTARQ